MKNYLAKNVDEYIANSSNESKPKLKELRATIKSVIPKAEEKISWGVPWYKYNGLLVGYAAYKNHVSLGPFWNVTLEDKDRKILEKKGYILKKKIIQIQFDQKIPSAIIKKMVKAQARINETNKK